MSRGTHQWLLVAAALTLASTCSAIELGSDRALVAYWPLASEARSPLKDVGPNKIDLSASGVTWKRHGDKYVPVLSPRGCFATPDRPVLQLGVRYTLGIWFRTREHVNNTFLLVKMAAEDYSYGIYLSGGSTVVAHYCKDRGGPIHAAPAIRDKDGRSFADGKWHFAVATLGDGVLRMFIDGRPEAEKDLGREIIPDDAGAAALQLGRYRWGSIQGEMGEAFILSRALPAGEVAQLYEDQFARYGGSSFAVHLARAAPEIDGTLNEQCWTNAAVMKDFEIIVDYPKPATRQTRARVCYDEDGLYVAIQADCEGDPLNLARAGKHDGGGIFHEDSVEVFLQPAMPEGKQLRVHLAFNALGTVYDSRTTDTGDIMLGSVTDEKWTLPTLRIATHLRKGVWTAELAIPFASLGEGVRPVGTWRFNICRNIVLGPGTIENSSYAALVGRFDQPEMFNTLQFQSDRAIVVRQTDRATDHITLRRPNATYAEVLGKRPGDYVTWAREVWDSTPAAMTDPAERRRDYQRRMRIRRKQCEAGILGEVLPWAMRTDMFRKTMTAKGKAHLLSPTESSEWLMALYREYGTQCVWDYQVAPGRNLFEEAFHAGASHMTPERHGKVERCQEVFLADPVLKRITLENIRKFGGMYKDFPFVSHVMGGDEVGLVPYQGDLAGAPEQVKLWDREIREKYGFGRYGMPTISYADLRRVKPRGEQDLQFIAFWRWANAKYMQDLRDYRKAVKALNPLWKFGTGPHGGIRSMTGFDCTALAEVVDFVSDDPYCSGEGVSKGRGIYNHGFISKFLSDVTGKQVNIYVQGFDHYGITATPERLREWTSQALKGGATMINFYLGDANEGSALHNEALRLANHLKTMPALKRPENPDSAILYSSMTRYSDGMLSPSDVVYTAYAFLAEQVGANFQFVTDRQLEQGKRSLSAYRLVYVPRAEYLTRKVARLIEAYVRKGGRLVIGDPLAFQSDIDGTSLVEFRTRLCGFRLIRKNQATQITMRTTAILPWPKNVMQLPVFPGNGHRVRRWWIENTRYDVALVGLGEQEPTVLGVFSNGKPAVVSRRVGKGSVIALAANPFMPAALVEPNVYQTHWGKFFRAVHRWAGCALDEPIWRFELPGPER